MALIQQQTGLGTLGKKKKHKNKLPQENPQNPPPAGPALPPAMTPEQLDAQTRTDWINNNHYGFLNQQRQGPAGTNYDQWLNETGYARVYDQAYDTARNTPGADPGMNFETFMQGQPGIDDRARFAYAHRPEGERQPNLFAGGGGHWSWWD